MIDLLLLIQSGIAVLAAVYIPGWGIVRALDGSRLLSLALAPAIGAAIAGAAAIVAPVLGMDWSVLPWALAVALAAGTALLLRRIGVRLPTTVLDGRLSPRAAIPLAPVWIVLAAAIAVVPIAVQARQPDAVLERWDTLYHLSALQRIRETGTASSLHLGSVSNTAGDPAVYPAGFHALASLVPGVPVPVLLNGAVLALSTVPWALGIALLARALFPRVGWAPFAAGVVAILIPASPLNLWIHLSPIPNLTGSALLPGALAGVVALWQVLLVRLRDEGEELESPVRTLVATLIAVGLAGMGLGVMHPNVAVTALLLVAVLTAVTGAPLWRRRPVLVAAPLLALAPVALLTYTPLGSAVTEFSGGLQLPWYMALRELLLGLLTVWPMALSVVIALLWWPGLVRAARGRQRWLAGAWLVFAAMYVDAVLDSPLNLSILYYRGQDRLSMPLAMLSAVLVVPGLQAWARVLGHRDGEGRRTGANRTTIGVLLLVAVVAALSSIPPRLDNAAKNLAPRYENRGRFLQADELEAWARIAPEMDQDLKVIASPFSGASHMYAIHGQKAYYPVAGMNQTQTDKNLNQSVSLAAGSPEHCQNFLDHGIGYIYQERRPYQYARAYDPINRPAPFPGTVLFETEHSRLIEIDCEGTEDTPG
ncbi:MAG: hypothetical protein DI635_12910 [Pseudoxanthomonas suwonensis]|nr:MAG: hypothetical protein DI635_12910 [Pseudoxanthomonas suwonensis]